MNRCEITRDLLPAYVDDIISQSGREYVDEHVSECEACKMALNEAKTEVRTENVKENITAKKPFKKVSLKKAVIVSVAVIIGIILLFFGTILVIDISSGGYNTLNRIFGIDTSTAVVESAFRVFPKQTREALGTVPEKVYKNSCSIVNFGNNYITETMVGKDKDKIYVVYLEAALTGVNSFEIHTFEIGIVDEHGEYIKLQRNGELTVVSVDLEESLRSNGVVCTYFHTYPSLCEWGYNREKDEYIDNFMLMCGYDDEQDIEDVRRAAEAEWEQYCKWVEEEKECMASEIRDLGVPEETIEEWMNFRIVTGE